MKKRKEEILRSKEQSTEQSTEQSKEQFKEQFAKRSSVESTEQSTDQSNNTYIYGVGMLAILAISVCVFFTYNTFQPKKLINDRLAAPPKGLHMP